MHLAPQRLEHADQDVVVAGGHNRFVEHLVSLTRPFMFPCSPYSWHRSANCRIPEALPSSPVLPLAGRQVVQGKTVRRRGFDIVHTDRPDKDALVGRTLG